MSTSLCAKRLVLAAVTAVLFFVFHHAAWATTKLADIYSRDQLRAGFEACVHLFPNAQPIDLNTIAPEWRAVALCSDDFAVLYSGRTKTPLLVVERLSRQSLIQARQVQRSNNFFPDTRVRRKDRAELRDYEHSGFDRGHLAPAANRSSPRVMLQSFALSNMVPQHPGNNRKTWNKLEQDTRKYVMRATGDVFVYSGPIFETEAVETLGQGGVWIPTHLFKLIFDFDLDRSWVHIVSNDDAPYRGPPVSYEQFVVRTGWHILPEK